MTPDSGYPDESARSTGSSAIPTSVPTSFYGQAQGDMLSQQVQADAASNDFQSQLIQDHVASQNDITSVKQLDQAMQPVRNANQYIGSNAWGSGHNTYCETFAEQMTDGKNEGGSAAEAFNNRLQSGQAVADPSLQGVSPGDLVYFGGAQENGGYGHVGVYAGNGRIISATVNGIQNYPISAFNAPVSGYAKTGGGGGGMGTIGENTGGGSGVNMNAPQMPHENKTEGGDNPPPPQFSGGSWAPPSADAFKDWFGSQVSKIFNAPPDAGNIAGQQMSDLGSKANEVAGDIGDTANQIGTDIHNAPGPLGQVAGAAGDLANVFAPKPGQSGLSGVPGAALNAATTPLNALGDVGNDLNPANIGKTLASDVGATTPMPSIPVLSGVTNVTNSLVAPGGVLGESEAATQAAAAAGQALPSELGGSALSNVALQRMGVPPIKGASELGSNINPAHLPDDVMPALDSEYEKNAPAIDVGRRGVVPNTQTMTEAQDLADATGSPVQQVIDKWQPGDVQNAAMMTAVRNALVDARRQASDAAEAWGADPSPANQAAKEAAQAAADRVQMVAQGLTAEMGRGLQAMGIDVTDPLIVNRMANDPEFWKDMGDKPNFGPSGQGLDVPILKGIQKAQDVAKQVLVSLSVFHPFVEEAQLARTFLGQGKPLQGLGAMTDAAHAFVSPDFLSGYLRANKDAVGRAEAAGTTLLRGEESPDLGSVVPRIIQSAVGAAGSGLSAYGEAKGTGASNSDALVRGAAGAALGAGAGAVAPALSKALWGRLVPVAKLEAFKALEGKYGADAAATTVNNTFGGQNLAKLGRTRQVQDVARLALLAPDWLESWARNAGGAFGVGVNGGISGPEAQAARKYWAATLIGGAVTLEGLNVALNGHSTDGNEPGHRFELETTGLLRALGQHPAQRTYLDINQLGPFGSTLNALDRQSGKGDPLGTVGALANSHLAVAPAAALGAIRNQGYIGGKQIVPRDTPAQESALPELANVAQRVTPIGLGAFENENVPFGQQLFSGLSGMRSSAGTSSGYHAFTPGAASGYRPFKPGSGGYRVR